MPLSVVRDLKTNVGDQLRGVRHLVRLLGSDVQRPHLAPPVLPEALPDMDRLLGKTFRVVDNVISAVETTVRPPAVSFRGFLPLEDYRVSRHGDGLEDDLYRGLKATVAIARTDELILKSRVAGVQVDVATRFTCSNRREERSAMLLCSLVRRDPLVDVCGESSPAAVLKHYVTLALLFGLADKRRHSEEDALSLVENSYLLANTRIETIGRILKGENAERQLASTLGVLLNHLA
ncbi:hypothetical protein [Agrobacterium pusense]|uniref:hypothetical protein n=1 Tax=Agrobacterium pusense TaxID=648995 RepID=UPI003FD48015